MLARSMNSNDQMIQPFLETNCIACGEQFINPVQRQTGVLCKTCSSQGLFRKKIIITGITRMNGGNVCVSGIDPETMRFIRPIFSTGLNRDFIMDGNSQAVRHFNLVEMEFRQYHPSQIFHTEDWLLNEKFAPRFIRQLSNGEVAQIVAHTSINDLKSALAPRNKSLFTVKARRILNIWHEQYEKFKVRVSFEDHSGNRFDRVPVTDLLTLSFVKYQLSQGNTNYAQQIISKFNSNPDRYVRIGMTREWQGQHWMQVTALITIPDLFGGIGFAHYERKIGGMA